MSCCPRSACTAPETFRPLDRHTEHSMVLEAENKVLSSQLDELTDQYLDEANKSASLHKDYLLKLQMLERSENQNCALQKQLDSIRTENYKLRAIQDALGKREADANLILAGLQEELCFCKRKLEQYESYFNQEGLRGRKTEGESAELRLALEQHKQALRVSQQSARKAQALQQDLRLVLVRVNKLNEQILALKGAIEAKDILIVDQQMKISGLHSRLQESRQDGVKYLKAMEALQDQLQRMVECNIQLQEQRTQLQCERRTLQQRLRCRDQELDSICSKVMAMEAGE